MIIRIIATSKQRKQVFFSTTIQHFELPQIKKLHFLRILWIKKN